MCLSGLDMICRNGELIGAITNGGSQNIFRYRYELFKIWKKFRLEEIKEALKGLFAKERNGRILLEVS